NMTLGVSSATPLDFSMRYTAGGITLAAPGIVTAGGDVTLNTDHGIDGTIGGIITGGATESGRVSLIASEPIKTGAINTTPTTGVGSAITVSCTTCGIDVNGNLATGVGGAAITLSARDSITRSGSSKVAAGKRGSVSKW